LAGLESNGRQRLAQFRAQKNVPERIFADMKRLVLIYPDIGKQSAGGGRVRFRSV